MIEEVDQAASPRDEPSVPPTTGVVEPTWVWVPLQASPEGLCTQGDDLVFLPNGAVVIENRSYGDGVAIEHGFGRFKGTRPPGFNQVLRLDDGSEIFRFCFWNSRWYPIVPHEAAPGEGTSGYAFRRDVAHYGTVGAVCAWLICGIFKFYLCLVILPYVLPFAILYYVLSFLVRVLKWLFRLCFHDAPVTRQADAKSKCQERTTSVRSALWEAQSDCLATHIRQGRLV
jgi:hypothetical protein